MTWGRARATRSSSQTWTSTRSRIWCGMSTVAGEKCESTFYCWISLAVGWVTSQTSLTFFWVLLTSMTSGDLEWSTSCRSAGSNSNRKPKITTIPNIPQKRGKDHLGNHFWPLLPIKAQFCFLCRDLKEECCQSLSANLAVDQVILFSCHDLGVQHKCDVKQMVFF